MRSAIYTRTSAADLVATVPNLLADLRRYVTDIRGWDVALELADQGPGIMGRREGLAELIKAVQAREVDVVVTTSLARLCRSQSHVIDMADLLEEDANAGRQEIALVALEDQVDTTTHDGRVRWRDAMDLCRRIRQSQRSEAVRLARLKTAVKGVDDTWGRPIAAINPFELAGHWHGSPVQRPLSVREIAARMGYAQGTIRKRLRELLDTGKLHSDLRTRHLAIHGGLRRGGRPAPLLDDATLAALWRKTPSLAAVARHLQVSRSRVRSRLQEIGLLSEDSQSWCPRAPGRSTDVE